LNEFENDTEMTDIFTKVSSFYSKDNITYEKKFCSFVVLLLGPQNSKTQIAEFEVDMGEFVNHNDSHQHIDFKCDHYSGLFLDVVWTIAESGLKNSRSSLTSMNSTLGLTLSEGTQSFTEA